AKGRLYEARGFLLLCEWMTPAGFVAVIAGWVVTEVGRQPWVIYELMRTSEGVTPSLTGPDVLASLLVYVAVYLVIFPAGLYYIVRLVRGGPPAAEIEPRVQGRQRPLPAAQPAEAGE